MTKKKYRVHEALKYNYSDIGEYIDENHTDKPLRNDIVVDLLNEQEETIQNQKMEMNLLLEEMKEIRDKLTIYLEIKGDME